MEIGVLFSPHTPAEFLVPTLAVAELDPFVNCFLYWATLSPLIPSGFICGHFLNNEDVTVFQVVISAPLWHFPPVSLGENHSSCFNTTEIRCMLICVCLFGRKRETLVLPYINSLFKKKHTFHEDEMSQNNAKIHCLFLLWRRRDCWPSLCRDYNPARPLLPFYRCRNWMSERYPLQKLELGFRPVWHQRFKLLSVYSSILLKKVYDIWIYFCPNHELWDTVFLAWIT